jgi:hypothetical protein
MNKPVIDNPALFGTAGHRDSGVESIREAKKGPDKRRREKFAF